MPEIQQHQQTEEKNCTGAIFGKVQEKSFACIFSQRVP